MPRPRSYRTFVGDFETTVYDGQDNTEVWASACVELFSEDAQVFHSIGDLYDYLLSLDCNVRIYFHNLKFDGAFWMDYLLNHLKYAQAFTPLTEDESRVEWIAERFMKNNTFRYAISDMGQWYNITIKVRNHMIEIRDSLKLLPFSVKRIGKGFKTKHQKLEMEYTGYRYAGCEITPEEQEYIKNDLYVVKEALEVMFTQGHDKMTIGSCCLADYKDIMGKTDYETFFPNVYEIEIPDPKYTNVGEWIRKSYKGGWCYLVPGKENKLFHHGTTADVNSLYPSMMHSESGNRYPVGKPHYWRGDYIDYEALHPNRYYFVRVRTRFYLKKDMLPCIQIKGNYLYKPNEWLVSSDVYDKKQDAYFPFYYDKLGNQHDTRVELTLTMTDFELIKEHYELVDFEIIDGMWFYSELGIFDQYIDKYKKIKVESKGAMRELAKLFLNNLYGKMASNTNSSFKVAYVKDNGVVGFYTVIENNKKPGFIPVGSAITSYARNFTIRAAQKNYHGVDKPGFIYADTDSIHTDLMPEDIVGIKVHPTDFCCWKLESCWDDGIFVRQKTYIEHVTHEDLEPIDSPYYNVKCAGMPASSKDLFIESMTGNHSDKFDEYPKRTKDFVTTKRTMEDFKVGLIVPGKLMPKRIKGGILLVETEYEMRDM